MRIGSTFDYWSRYANTVANIQSWNFAVQTQLAPNLALDVAYVGTKGTHLSVPENINQLNDAYIAFGSTLLNSNINSPAVAAAGFSAPWSGYASALGASATLAQALRPYPQYLAGFGYNSDNDGNSSYEALQAKIEKRSVKRPLCLAQDFTWDKNITDANTTLLSTPGNNPSGAGRVRDQNNRHLDKSVASKCGSRWSSLRRSVMSCLLAPARCSSTGWHLGRVIGGWRLNGILTYRTGSAHQRERPSRRCPTLPVPTMPTPCSTFNRREPGAVAFDPAVNRYLNINAFAVPTGYGTGGQYLPDLRGPVYIDEDLSLSKASR